MPTIQPQYSRFFAIQNYSKVKFFRGILDKCVSDIDAIGAWPDIPNVPYEIHILENGGILRKNDNSNFDPSAKKYEPVDLRLEVSLDYFDSKPAQHFLDRKLTHEQILTQALGHEIFHLDEITRGSDSDLEFKLRRSGFAKSIRPFMNPDWRALVEATAMAFISYSRPIKGRKSSLFLDDQTLRAIDTVSEGCADLLGIKIFNKIFTDPLVQDKMIKALIDFRKSSELISKNEYQIGSALDNFNNANAGPDYPMEDIVRQTWQMAIGELLQSTQVSQDLKTKMNHIILGFQNGLPLVFQPNPSSTKPTVP